MGWCLAIGAGRHFPTSHLPILLVLMLRDRSNQPVSLKRFTTIPTRRPAVKKALSEKALSKRIVGRYDALRQRSTTPHGGHHHACTKPGRRRAGWRARTRPLAPAEPRPAAPRGGAGALGRGLRHPTTGGRRTRPHRRRSRDGTA